MQVEFSIVKIADPWRNSRTWMLIGGVAAVLLLGTLLTPTSAGARLPGLALPPCPFRAFTGIPCPFCGMTSGTAWLIRGDFYAAWKSNILSYPFLAIVLAAGVYAVSFRLLAGRKVHTSLSPPLRLALWTGSVVLVALSWVLRLPVWPG